MPQRNVTFKLMGGLGNQLFQYAFSLAYSSRHSNIHAQYNVNYYNINSGAAHAGWDRQLEILNYKPDLEIRKQNITIDRLLKRIGYYDHFGYVERNLKYNNQLLDSRYNYFEGYFQSYKYFESLHPPLQNKLILSDIKIKDEVNDFVSENFSDKPNANIAMHVRRGDYTSANNSSHLLLPTNYFHHCYKTLKSPGIRFYVFSDDVEWAKSLFSGNEDIFVVADTRTIYTFELMRRCDSFIISNSTYSWWAAWLSNNENKIVFSPMHWFRRQEDNKYLENLVPTDWIKIDCTSI